MIHWTCTFHTDCWWHDCFFFKNLLLCFTGWCLMNQQKSMNFCSIHYTQVFIPWIFCIFFQTSRFLHSFWGNRNTFTFYFQSKKIKIWNEIRKQNKNATDRCQKIKSINVCVLRLFFLDIFVHLCIKLKNSKFFFQTFKRSNIVQQP